MPLPPFQTDPRTEKLPPQATAHAGTGGFAVQGSPAVLLVTHPQQLPAALKQHQTPVVMENTPANAGLIRDFEQLLRWQRWKDTHQLLLIAALLFIVFMAGIIANRYGLEFGWYFNWTVIEMGGKITLTPP